jgi:SAM-dependent methyltransferase
MSGLPGIPPAAFRRLDEGPDEVFYREPRFVAHLDEDAIAAVTDLYRTYFPPGGEILDLMSSWISHLPPEAHYGRVVGVGMNDQELAENPFLDEWLVQNLNSEPRLPFATASFDGAAICVSIQYLTRPVEVLRDVGRVLRPGAPLVITFSNRCFPTKAIACWQLLDDEGHRQLVANYLLQSGGWTDIRHCGGRGRGGDPLYGVVARSLGAAGEAPSA